MNDCRWHFHVQSQKETARESLVEAFFRADAVSSPTQDIIREGVQNSLDAIIPGSPTTRIRIYVSGDINALKKPVWEKYFESGMTHWNATGNGLPLPITSCGDACNFLVFEDFGTSGLEGDIRTSYVDTTHKNSFYNFFRAEGRTDKTGDSRGSWGVGKHVFMKNSKIKTMLALTNRKSDGKSLLMGRTVLKIHTLGDDKKRYQDGYYGVDGGEESPYLPSEDNDLIRNFKRDFNLKRGDDPGLSIVIPWLEQEKEDELFVSETPESIRIALRTAQEYFYPIITGRLSVTIECSNESSVVLDSAASIRNLISEVDGYLCQEHKGLLLELESLVLMSEDSTQPNVTTAIPKGEAKTNAWQWSPALFKDGELEAIKAALDNNNAQCIRVPVCIWKAGAGTPESSFLDIRLLKKANDTQSRTRFIRDGILISNVNSRSNEYYSMVIIGAGPLGQMLRDSENPAHTEWQANILKSLKKYGKGTVTGLRFVTRCIPEIANLLSGSSKTKDKQLLADIFSIDMHSENDDGVVKNKAASGKDGRENSPPSVPEIQHKRPWLKIKRGVDGFVISGNRETEYPEKVVVEMAYDTSRSSSPLKKYIRHDFDVSKTPIKINHSGGDHLSKSGNIIEFKPSTHDFVLEVSGFDINRQLYLRATPVTKAGEEEAEDVG